MAMSLFGTAALLAATVASGLQAGLYYAFACAVLPGLARDDDRTFVGFMQQVNVAIINPWFLATFLGAPVLSGAAVVLQIGGSRSTLVATAAGFALAVATVVITAAANVPLNNRLAAVGDPDQSGDLAGVRAAFETTWARWNIARVLTSTGSLIALAAALAIGP